MLVLDGNGTRLGRGQLVNESFGEARMNIRFSNNSVTDPTYLIGFATRPILKGEELLAMYGRKYWCNRVHFEQLDEPTKAMARKCYAITDKDLF